jgi:superfamily II DNA or RNA helicase
MSSRTLRLRVWQRRALDSFQASSDPDFLAVATPGAGKTTFALVAARLTLPNLPGRLVVVAPTSHLKEQWADAGQRLGLHLVTDWRPGDLVPADAHGVVTTYQQVGNSPEPFFPLSQGGFVILDEIHHAGDERSWGDGVRVAFDGASRRLALSGTPFRSDTRSIPFVTYHLDEVVPDIEYGYGQALADRQVVRPVYFPRFGGHMEWTAPDGAVLAATFDDPLARTQANQRLRAALSLEGEWLPAVIGHADEQLNRIREQHVNAGGLVIAMDQDHAKGVARMLRRRFGRRAIIATSDDPDSSAKISRFADGEDPWIVAVRMISEGVDIPRLRVAVYATTTTTELFFRQAVGRIVRHSGGRRRQRAYMFIPDDLRLRHFGYAIADSRRHNLRSRARSRVDDDELDELRSDGDADQMSLFSVLSATASETPEETDIFAHLDEEDDESPSDSSWVEAGAASPMGTIDDDVVIGEMPDLTLDLSALPPPVAGMSPMGSAVFDRNERDRLRRINNELTKELVDITSRSHAQVNAELNRRAGIAKVSEATIVQLNRRSRAAEEWLRREHRRSRYAKFV